jgi:hypothetical protein
MCSKPMPRCSKDRTQLIQGSTLSEGARHVAHVVTAWSTCGPTALPPARGWLRRRKLQRLTEHKLQIRTAVAGQEQPHETLCRISGFHGDDYEEEEWRDEGNRIYHRFWRFPAIARLSFWLSVGI